MTTSRNHWRFTLAPESCDLLSRLGGECYLVPFGTHRALIQRAASDAGGHFYIRSSFPAAVVQELLDWNLIQLQGTADGRVPMHYNLDNEVVEGAFGCTVRLTDAGITAARQLREPYED